MKPYRTTQRRKYKSPEAVFVLLLLCLFAFAALMMVLFGSRAYTGISEQKELHFQRLTPLSYIAAKARQCQGPAAVREDECEGVSALVFAANDGGVPCETWLYEYDGSLYELYIDAGAAFTPADGTAIAESRGLSFSLREDRLTLRAADQRGAESELTLVLRGGASDE